MKNKFSQKIMEFSVLYIGLIKSSETEALNLKNLHEQLSNLHNKSLQ